MGKPRATQDPCALFGFLMKCSGTPSSLQLLGMLTALPSSLHQQYTHSVGGGMGGFVGQWEMKKGQLLWMESTQHSWFCSALKLSLGRAEARCSTFLPLHLIELHKRLHYTGQ